MNDQIVVHQFQSNTPQRLDTFLVARLPDFSRSRIQRLIRETLVTINGECARKSGQMVDRGSIVEVRIPPIQPSKVRPENIPLEIIFENEDVLVVNKPAGMVVHPSAGHPSGTLVNAALAYAPEMEGIGGEHRPGVVHRLDKDTSGVILLAKNDRTHQYLQNQFRNRLVRKKYLALVDGSPPTSQGKVVASIGRHNHDRKKMTIVSSPKGRNAVTEFLSIEAFEDHTLLEVHPITGRTHQIRLHLAFLGCPVVGDRTYGLRKPSLRIKRQFLHAAAIKINLIGESIPATFSAPLPNELTHVLNNLRRLR